VERDGQAVSVAEWQAAAPRELFFFLLFYGPKSRFETEVVFWPESTPDRAQALFHTALHRARQALGSNVILFENDMYLVNPDLNIEIDAYQLESWTTQARLLSSSDARADDLWRKAVEIYKGDFLRSLDAQWIVARREAYSQMYRNALGGLAHCARARNDLNTAVEWFSAAIAIDPYSEDTYRQIMRCYATLGEMGKVRTWFYDLKKVLRDELGIEPSEETTSMARSILGNV
jgi:DNA-binding SARP family transcriptional activator